MAEAVIDVTPEPGPGRFSRFFARLRESLRVLGRGLAIVLKWITIRVVMAIMIMFLGAWGTQYYKYDWFGFVPVCSGTRVVSTTTTTIDPDALAQAIVRKLPPPSAPGVDADRLAAKVADKLPPFPMSREEWEDFVAKANVGNSLIPLKNELDTIRKKIDELPAPSCSPPVSEPARVTTSGEYCPALKPCSPLESASKLKACLNDLEEAGEHYKALWNRARALHNQGEKTMYVKPY